MLEFVVEESRDTSIAGCYRKSNVTWLATFLHGLQLDAWATPMLKC
jgi:hypothetical protein